MNASPLRHPAAPTLLPIVCLLMNAFIWGVSWWPFRELDALGLHSLWATAFAFIAATLLLSLWRPAAWPALLARPALAWLVLATGLTNAAFNWGVIIGEVVRVVLLFYLMPVWAALLARWLLDEPITREAAARVLLAIAGAAVVLYEPQTGLPLPATLGDWLGLAGGGAFAVVNVLVRRHAEVPDEARALAMFAGGALVPLALAALLATAGRIDFPPAPAPLWLAGAAGLAALLLTGNLALQFGAARLPSSVTALVMLSEVVFAALSSAWIGGEPLDARTLLGGAMIVIAAALAARPRRLFSDARPRSTA